VVFDGMNAAKARNVDVVLVDTAGRLQTKTNLMEELKKMRRVIEHETGAPPAETLLVVDGTTGQNALSQAKLFNEATQLTGVVVTKLDSTAKGGVLVGIVDQLGALMLARLPGRNVGAGGVDEHGHPALIHHVHRLEHDLAAGRLVELLNGEAVGGKDLHRRSRDLLRCADEMSEIIGLDVEKVAGLGFGDHQSVARRPRPGIRCGWSDTRSGERCARDRLRPPPKA